MKDTEAILKILYPKVKKNIDANTLKRYKVLMSNFFDKRSKSLYDTCPCDRIYYGMDDAKELYDCFKISESEVAEAISNTYYYKIAKFNPLAAKDEVTVLCLCIVKYFIDTKMDKEAELAGIYLAFSGKMYPSVHTGSYRKFTPAEYRHVMEYAVNNMSESFDLKKYGSVIGAIRSLVNTWINAYKNNRFKTFDDEDVVYLIQQLHDREKIFTQNIANLYYTAYANKEYLSYDSDDMSEDNYRLADNDSLKIERYSESAMNYMSANGADYRICMLSAYTPVKAEELQSIVETIIGDTNNIPTLKELFSLILSQYFLNTTTTKDPTNIDFISTSIAVKPNAKDKDIVRIKTIIEEWLDEGSPNYRKRKSRPGTRSIYNKSLMTYFVMVIHYSAKGGIA